MAPGTERVRGAYRVVKTLYKKDYVRNYAGQMQLAQCVCLSWRKRPRNTSRVELDAQLVKCFAWAKIVFHCFFFEIWIFVQVI